MPPTNARPLVGITRVVSMPAVVVLPAPLGPSRPKISPWCTSRSSSSTALSPPGYTLVSCSVRMTTSSTTAIGHLLLPLLHRAGLAECSLLEVGVDAREGTTEHLDVALGEDPAHLVVELVHDRVQLAQPRQPRGRDDDAHDAPVVGIGTTLDQTVLGE